uniref:Uncharacterized protein n=1 Tax=Acrobeloides nanus TaxID=290746 RepID=A0A914C3K1_9BILA
MSQSLKPYDQEEKDVEQKSFTNWVIQRIILDGIIWHKRKPRQLSGHSANKILRYLAVAEFTVEVIVLTFLIVILWTESHVRHEKEEYEFMIMLVLPFFIIRTSINLCTIMAATKKRTLWMYPAYLFHLLFSLTTSLLLGLTFGGLVLATLYYLVMDVKHSLTCLVLALVDAGLAYLFIDFTYWIYGILDAARLNVQGIRENVSNVTNVE